MTDNTQTELATTETPAQTTQVTTEPTRVFTARPPIDIHEDDAGFTVYADVPGATADTVELELNRGNLSLAATRTTPRGRVRYTRTFVLPDVADAEAIEANLKHGVLTVRVPKRAAALPRKIAVKVE